MELGFLLLNITRLLANPALYARNLLLLVVFETLDVARPPGTLEVNLGPADFQTQHILWDASHGVCEILNFLKWE